MPSHPDRVRKNNENDKDERDSCPHIFGYWLDGVFMCQTCGKPAPAIKPKLGPIEEVSGY